MSLKTPVSFFWEVSYACNLACRHCYTNSDMFKVIPTNWHDVKDFLDQMKSMGIFTYAIGGGEPMVLPFIYDMIEYSTSIGLGVSITSNGTLIGPKEAKKLKKAGLDVIQISIDGTNQTHDNIRGGGTFEKAIRAVNFLNEEGIAVRFGTTINKENYNEIPDIIQIAKDNFVQVVAFFRYMPTSKRGDGLELDKHDMLRVARSLVECDKNSIKVRNEHGEKFYLNFTPLSFFTFLIREKDLHNTICTAGRGKFNLQSNGSVTPCSHLPMVMGNIFEEDPYTVWRKFEKITDDINTIPKNCLSCRYANLCRGGCKGISYIKHGDFSHKDDACFLDLLN